jgi:hypothetical protein
VVLPFVVENAGVDRVAFELDEFVGGDMVMMEVGDFDAELMCGRRRIRGRLLSMKGKFDVTEVRVDLG